MDRTLTRIDTAEAPSVFDSWAARTLLKAIDAAPVGPLVCTLPSGQRLTLGQQSYDRTVQIEIRDWRVFRRLLIESDIGAGETYAQGWWDTDDLAELCARLLGCESFWAESKWFELLVRWKHRLAWLQQRNTLRGSRRNIAFHYDLSNDLYRLFLDPTMTYSCADFADPARSLEQAQLAKLDGVCRALALQPGQHLLEIGCGWGSLAVHAAQSYGVRVTGITLSERQLEWARNAARERGLADRVSFELMDYRRVRGEFDAVASIEMFEAVGHEYYAAFFSAVDRCLRPGGRFFLQTITVPDQRYDTYRKGFDFIKKHIFPGGLLASLERILSTVRAHTSLRLEGMREIGPFYAHTLRAWRERFVAHRAQVLGLGFSRVWTRLWEFYLASCEAAFSIRHIGDAQLLFWKPAHSREALRCAQALPPLPIENWSSSRD